VVELTDEEIDALRKRTWEGAPELTDPGLTAVVSRQSFHLGSARLIDGGVSPKMARGWLDGSPNREEI